MCYCGDKSAAFKSFLAKECVAWCWRGIFFAKMRRDKTLRNWLDTSKGSHKMGSKKILSKSLVCGVAMSLLALAPVVANAQGDMMNKGADSAGMKSDSSMMTPMMVSGTVLRYYSDRSGYVTAMDVQTADGVKFVRFSPGMGQRLYSTYPVGGTANVYVAQSSGMMSPTVVGVGGTMPSPGMMSMSDVPSDVDVLNSEPYIMSGAKLVTMRGSLRDIITNDQGEVVGLVIKSKSMMGKDMMGKEMMGKDMSASMPMDSSASTSMAMMPAMMPGMTLVRVPREFRQIAPGYAGTERVAPLFKGADIEVTGYPEAPRYGVLSTFGNRIAARALVVNARAVGAVGIQRMSMGKHSLFRNVNIGGAGRSAEEMKASSMGYSTYGMNGATNDTMTSSSSTTSSSNTTTTTTNQ